jgi:hypothetical protein
MSLKGGSTESRPRAETTLSHPLAASQPFLGSIFRLRDPYGVLNRFGRKRFELEPFAKEAREVLLEAAG